MALGVEMFVVLMHGIGPFRYLADALQRLSNTPPDRLAELLSDAWFQAHRNAARKRAA
jgi:hypothetical protein